MLIPTEMRQGRVEEKDKDIMKKFVKEGWSELQLRRVKDETKR